MKKFLILSFLLFNFSVYSQELPKIAPPSPNAASLGEYGQIPVGLFTGTIQTAIPLYNFTSGKLSLPISLSYRSNGVKVDQIASDVGLGWVLDAGGVITRFLNVLPDEKYSKTYPPVNFPVANGAGQSETFSYINTNINEHDTATDLFSFNFNGYAGQFYLDQNNIPILINQSALKIEYTQGTPYRFRIIDTQGVIYYFGSVGGESGRSIETSRTITPGEIVPEIPESSWYLTKIVHPTGGTIDLTYTIVPDYTYNVGLSEQLSLPIYPSGSIFPGGPNFPTPTIPSFAYRVQMSETTVYTPVILNSIEGSNGSIEFTYSSRGTIVGLNKLDEIKIKDSHNQLLKSIDLNYQVIESVFPNNPINNFEENKRLFLTGVIEKDKLGNNIKPYVFSYYNPSMLAPRFSMARDIWGYSNGASTNNYFTNIDLYNSDAYPSSLFTGLQNYLKFSERELEYVDDLVGSVDSSPNTNYSINGVLKKISYPTGGFTEFFYEAQSYRDTIANANIEIGGLRVSKVVINDGKNKEEIKNYYYGDLDCLECSSGIAEPIIPRVIRRIIKGRFQDPNDIYPDKDLDYSLLNFGNGTFNDLFTKQGINVGYKTVVEGIGDDFEGGGTLIEYEIPETQRGILVSQPHHSYSFVSPSPNTNIFGMGRELKRKLFKKTGSNYIILNEVSNTYIHNPVLDKEEINYVGTQYFMYPDYDPSLVDFINSFDIMKYLIRSQWHYLSSSIESQFDKDGLNPVTTTKNYYYDNSTHLQVTRINTNTSKGESLITMQFYPEDVITSSPFGAFLSPAEQAAVIELRDRHRVIPLETYTFKDSNNNDIGDFNELLSVQRTNYFEPHSDIIVPKEVQTLKGNFNPTTNSLETRITYHDFDDKGNPLEVSKTDGAHICYIWGYNREHPIAKIENATYAQVEFAVATLSSSYNSIEKIQTLSDLDNDSTIGATGTEGVLRTAFIALRNVLSEAMVTTYTYDPLIGLTSITDSRGQTIYYEYDAFNRLKTVKDADGNILNQTEYHYINQE